MDHLHRGGSKGTEDGIMGKRINSRNPAAIGNPAAVKPPRTAKPIEDGPAGGNPSLLQEEFQTGDDVSFHLFDNSAGCFLQRHP